MKVNFLKKIDALHIGLILLGWIGFIYFFSTLLFFLNIIVSNYSCWSVTLIYILLLYFFLKKYYINNNIPTLNIIYNVVVSILIVLLSFLISNYFIDNSFDGQYYHGPAIIHIYNGWNPNYNYITEKGIIGICINHFAKASWITGGFLYKLTGSFQCAKATSIILMAANFFIALYFFRKRDFSNTLAIIISLLLACNPIWLNMYLSNMLDSQVANCTYIFAILIILYLEEKKIVLLPFLYLTIVYAVNLKFSVLVYFTIFCVALFAYLLYKKELLKNKRLIIHISFAMLLAVLVIGYQTYVKNTLLFGHPFYPFYSKNSVPIVSNVEALDYKTGNTFWNFIKSNFAATNFNQAYTQHLKYKIPFSISRYELERYAFAGVMIGGFGVWFSGALLISLALLIYIFIKRKHEIFKADFQYYFFLIVVFASVVINPYAYIARYSPQYYLIPFIVLIFFHKHFKEKKFMKYMICAILVMNSLLICGYSYYNVVVTKTVISQMERIKKSNQSIEINFGNHTSKKILFDEYKIPYTEVANFEKVVHTDTLFRSEVVYKFK